MHNSYQSYTQLWKVFAGLTRQFKKDPSFILSCKRGWFSQIALSSFMVAEGWADLNTVLPATSTSAPA